MLVVISDPDSEDDTGIRIFDTKDLTLQRQVEGRFLDLNKSMALAVDPSSRYLASACYAGGVCLFELVGRRVGTREMVTGSNVFYW
jgi:hypothetical protein